jgi:RNA polymerase sigma-70 factor (ECF subfamily)
VERTLRLVGDRRVLASETDLALVERLRAGDETAFMMLVEQHQSAMLRIARMYVSSRAVAEEAVQEAWLGIVEGLERFEGRPRSAPGCTDRREHREDAWEGRGTERPVLLAGGRRGVGHRRGRRVVPGRGRAVPGRLAHVPGNLDRDPEDRLIGDETLAHIGRAIDTCLRCRPRSSAYATSWAGPPRRCVTLFDLSETNQRVLLHRARSRVRREPTST